MPVGLERLWLEFPLDTIARKYGDGAAVGVFFFCMLVFGFLLMVFIMACSRAAHRKRRLLREAWGQRYGLRIIEPEETSRKLFQHVGTEIGAKVLADYPYANFPKGNLCVAMHILEGAVDGLTARVFEYSYTTGSGKTTNEHHYSVVAFHFPSIKGHLAFERRYKKNPEGIKTGHSALDETFAIEADEWKLLTNELPFEIEKLMVEGITDKFVMAGDKLVVATKNRLKDKHYDQLFAEGREYAKWLEPKH